jgi:hypothetical protein
MSLANLFVSWKDAHFKILLIIWKLSLDKRNNQKALNHKKLSILTKIDKMEILISTSIFWPSKI